MADTDEKAKAEKIAAAKKRVEQMKKQKAKKGSGSGKKEKKGDKDAEGTTDAPALEASSSQDPTAEEIDEASIEAPKETEAEEPKDAPAAMQTGGSSLAEQSRLRSTSFRSGGGGGGPVSPTQLFSPDGETAPDIYRKHVARIEELEKENKRMAKEAGDAEKRWQRAENELADLQEGDTNSKQIEKLRKEVEALQRQNSQLQTQVSRAGSRHGSSPSMSMSASPSEVEAQLQSKAATIETMELEMSRLRAQVERLSVNADATEHEQVRALEEKLARAEKAAGSAQRELADVKRNLDRMAEKAVKAGSERTSAETKLRTLEREVAELAAARDDLAKKCEALEMKAATLTTLHREQDARSQALRRDKEKAEADLGDARARLDKAEAENLRLHKKHASEGAGDDDALDELENEGRQALEKRVRELEAENTDLRRGIWHQRRKDMQEGPDERFTDVDLGSIASPTTAGKQGAHGNGGLGFFSAITGAAGGGGGGATAEDSLLEDEDMDFDEDAFRKAQEEEAKKRLERIREVKRTLKNWEGFRLDLVDIRRGGGEGVGEIFEI